MAIRRSLPDSLRIHSSPGTLIAQRPGRFPVIVFSPGFGTPGLAYSIQLEDLASHGYIVASVTRPPASSLTVFPDGRVTTMAPETQSHMERNETERLTAWTLDVQFVLHQLLDDVQTGHAAPWRGRVEASAVGVFGHSLGGRVSAEACLKDSRIKACLDQDGMLPGGLPFSPKGDRHPLKAAFLLMTTSTSTRMPTADELARMNQTQSQFEEMLRELQRARSRLFANIHGGSHRLVLDVPGISHQSFSDLPFVAAFTSQDRRNAQRVLDVTRTCVVAFFDQYLRNSTVSLKERAAVLPEIRAEHFTANDH